jgi:hypothetical protein
MDSTSAMASMWTNRLVCVLALVTGCVRGTNRCLIDSDCDDGHRCDQQICIAPQGPLGPPPCLGQGCDGTLPVAVVRAGPEGPLGSADVWALLDRPERWGFVSFADVTGDGRADLIAVERGPQPGVAGTIWVAAAEGTRFGVPRTAGTAWCPDGAACRLADVDGDGRADLIPVRAIAGSPNRPMVLGSSGAPPVFEELAPVAQACLSGEVCEAGDVDGDKRADLVVFTRGKAGVPGTGNVLVARAGLSGFGDAEVWHPAFCIEEEDCHVGDIDGDGKADIIVLAKENRPGDHALRLALSTGTRFREVSQAAGEVPLCDKTAVCTVADVDGDRKEELIVFGRGSEGLVWRVRSLEATAPQAELWGTGVCGGRDSCQLADVAGSGRRQPISVPLPPP